jgi:2',3'-cyclic-nucleotide 2'-phosphodiesterase (5'-nucleotidase family)
MCAVEVDCVLLNGGSIRSDRLHPAGSFKFKDLRDILSFENELSVLKVTG